MFDDFHDRGGVVAGEGLMGIVVIGGLITSTFLSLLVIPVVFTFVDDLVQWVGRHAHRRRHAAGSLPAPIGE